MTSPIDKYWHGTEYNDTPPEMGIVIKRANVTGVYARCVVIHLLTKAENGGNHNLYLDVIDQGGKRINNSLLLGRNNNISLSAQIDKPLNEFGTNFAMYNQDTVSCWVGAVPGLGAIPSDAAMNFSTRWGGPIVGDQDYGHISFYVIFQVTSGTPIPPPLPPADCAELQQKYNKALADLTAIKEIVKEY